MSYAGVTEICAVGQKTGRDEGEKNRIKWWLPGDSNPEPID